MLFTEDIIKKGIEAGFTPQLVSGKKEVRLYICHHCKRKSMVKMKGPEYACYACKCGYRKKI